VRKSAAPFGLGELLSDRLKAMGLEQNIREQRAMLVWNEVVGAQVASAAQPEFARDGILFVVTKSAVWANELTFLKREIISKLNQKLRGNAIRDIVLRTGKIKPPLRTDGESPEAILEGIPLSDEELEQVEGIAQLAGPVGESVRELLATVLRLEKWKKSKGWKPCKRCGALQNRRSGICPICVEEKVRTSKRSE